MTPAPVRDPLPTPDDATFAALDALTTGAFLDLDYEAGGVVVTLDTGATTVVGGEHLDALFARGWIVADDDALTVETTEAGGYWLDRWRARQKRKPARRPRRRPQRRSR